MKKIYLPAAILFGFILINNANCSHGDQDQCNAPMPTDYFKKVASEKLPQQQTLYSLVDLESIFADVMHPKTASTFRTYFEIMYEKMDDNKFDKPKMHPTQMIIKFLQCLYARLLEAKEQPDADDLQLAELDKSLAYHKHLFPTELANKIKGFPCSSCMNTDKIELGISTDPE